MFKKKGKRKCKVITVNMIPRTFYVTQTTKNHVRDIHLHCKSQNLLDYKEFFRKSGCLQYNCNTGYT